MGIREKFDVDEGEIEVYLSGDPKDIEYLQRFALFQHIMNDLFPFRIVTTENIHDFHEMPETIQ